MQPIIGLVGSQMRKKDTNFIDSRFEYVQNVNSEAIRNAGGLPVILPTPKENIAEIATAYLTKVDGLFFLGGEDIDPTLYGQEPSQLLGEVDYPRDRFEIELYRQARAKKIPVLGICRGLQMVNIAEGGTLHQDLSFADKDLIKHSQLPTSVDYPTHSIKTVNGTWLNDILGDEYFVNSVHHQIINKLGADLEVLANANDGVIEAVATKDNLVWAVQFHPEWLLADNKMQMIFNKFIERIN